MTRRVRVTCQALPAQRAFFDCREFLAVYIGGFGAGKTFAAALKSLALAAANPGLPGLILAPTERMAGDVNLPACLDLLTAHQVPHEFRAARAELAFPWGSTVLFRSAEKPDRLKGLNLAWAGLDEAAQMKEAAFEIALSRVRHPAAALRQIFVTTTRRDSTGSTAASWRHP